MKDQRSVLIHGVDDAKCNLGGRKGYNGNFDDSDVSGAGGNGDDAANGEDGSKRSGEDRVDRILESSPCI